MSTASRVFQYDPSLRHCAINAIDPRVRVLVFLAFAFEAALVQRDRTILTALAVIVLVMLVARLPWRWWLRRLVPVNAFMLVLAAIVPWSTPGEPLFTLAGWTYSSEGLYLALRVAVRANTVVLAMLVLLGTMELPTLGHALSHLRVPDKLVHLLLFTVRYVEILFAEYTRLRTAMRLRGFRPRCSRHTYRAFGYLIGMLLVRSIDRSERVLAAMRCRGFRGRFYLLDHFHFHRVDAWFLAGAGLICLLLPALELLP